MISVFSKQGISEIQKIKSKKTLFAFDFDGTLVRIGDHPKGVALSPLTKKLLTKLAENESVVVISGRGLKELCELIPLHPENLIGNHGIESLGPKTNSLKKMQQTAREWKKQLSHQRFSKGIFIEDKIYSLTLHYRNAKTKRARDEISRAVFNLYPKPRIIGGKAVINLLPSDVHHKGSALIKFIRNQNFKKVIYVGDDETDEDVFKLQDRFLVSIRVGAKKSSHAAFFLENQRQINKFLQLLLDINISKSNKNKKRSQNPLPAPLKPSR